MGLMEGYDGGSHIHEPIEAEQVVLNWMRERKAAGRDYLTGLFTAANLAHASDTAGVGTTEPAVVFSGEVSVTYLPHLSDDEVMLQLDDLAARLGEALGQTRVYISYREQAWVIEAEGKTSPRTMRSEPSA